MLVSSLLASLSQLINGWASRSTYGFFAALALSILVNLLMEPVELVHRYAPISSRLPDEAYVGRRAADFVGNPPTVLILGGSSMRESVPTAVEFGSSLAGQCSYSPSMFNAATSSQHPADGWAVIDAIGRTPRLILVGLTYRRMIFDRSNDPDDISAQRVELPRSPTATRIAAANADIRSGLFDSVAQIGRMRFSLGEIRRMRGLQNPNNFTNLSTFDDRDAFSSPPISGALKRFTGDKWLATYGWTGAERFKPLVVYWRDFAERLQRRGARVIFVVTPEGPEMHPMRRTLETEFMRALTELRTTAPVADLRDSMNDPAQFHDPIHLTNQGRDTLWPRLSSLITKELGCKVPVARI